MSWSYTYDPQIWPAITTAILTAVLGWYGWQRRNFAGAKPFTLLCLFAFLWAVGCALEVSATDFSTQIFWIKFQAIWQMPEATTWPWFVLAYAGLNRWLTRRNVVWLLIFPSIIAFVLMITNNYHNLVWTGFQMGDHVIQSFGIANWILLGYAVILVLFTVIVLWWLIFRSPHLHWPAIIMSLGMIIAFGIYWLVNLDAGLLGPGERVLFTMGIVSLSFSVAFFRFRALDPIPLAHSAIIKQMQGGVLVFDLQNKVVDLNPAAGQILGSSAKSLWGRPAAEILPAELSVPTWLEKPETVPSEIKLGTGSDIHYYNLRFTPLKDQRNRTLGYILLLYDVTEQKRAQEQILVNKQLAATLQERERLARELHDSIGQVLGYVDLQAQTIRKLMRAGKNAEAEPELSNLIEAARDAHTDVRESILNLKTGTGAGWSFLPVLKQYLRDFQSRHGTHTELIVPEGLKDNIYDTDTGVQLLRVIQEALTNARKHSKGKNVRIDITLEDYWVHISITDDGMGFDTGMGNKDRSQHFGIDFMRERMEQIGGSVVIESRLGVGTVVNLKTPIGNPEEKKI